MPLTIEPRILNAGTDTNPYRRALPLLGEFKRVLGEYTRSQPFMEGVGVIMKEAYPTTHGDDQGTEVWIVITGTLAAPVSPESIERWLETLEGMWRGVETDNKLLPHLKVKIVPRIRVSYVITEGREF